MIQAVAFIISAIAIAISAIAIAISANTFAILAIAFAILANSIAISANAIAISANSIAILANSIAILANAIAISAIAEIDFVITIVISAIKDVAKQVSICVRISGNTKMRSHKLLMNALASKYHRHRTKKQSQFVSD